MIALPVPGYSIYMVFWGILILVYPGTDTVVLLLYCMIQYMIQDTTQMHFNHYNHLSTDRIVSSFKFQVSSFKLQASSISAVYIILCRVRVVEFRMPPSFIQFNVTTDRQNASGAKTRRNRHTTTQPAPARSWWC